MAKIFSSVNEVRSLPDSPAKKILLDDLEPKPEDCREYGDVLECADTTAVLVEPGDDIHNLLVNGNGPFDLTDFKEMYYEDIEFIAGGRMLIATQIWTRYYIPTDILSTEEHGLFRQRVQSWTREDI